MADRTVTYRLSADIGQFKAQMAQAAAATKGAADKMTGATKEGAKFRTSLSTLGGTAGKVGLVAAAGLGAAVMASANFDQAMSKVEAATHESAANMDRLRDAAIKAGAETVFSASEAAAGIENLAKAGVSTTDILAGGLSGALDLAAAGSMEVADAAETAATAMTQFGLKGTDVPHVADLLAAAAGKAQGEVSDFGMALNQSGLVAAQMGMSIEETTGSLAAFASAGLLGSDAGTALKTMLLRLANPSKEAAGLMEDLGINAYDAQGNMVPLANLAGQLQNAFKGQSQATRDAALATIFGSDAIRAANVLYSQGASGINDWTAKVDDSGYAAETAATKLDNLKGDLEAFKGSLETALIGTGDGSQGALRGLVQSLTDVVNAYNKLPPAAQSATGAILGVTAVLGGGLWFGAKVVQGVANTRQALSDLGVQAGATKTALSGVGKALAFGAAIEGVGLLDAALDNLFNRDFDNSGLQRSLDALASGNIAGTIADVWGSNLDGLNSDLDVLDNNLARITDFPDKLLPGDITESSQARTNIQAIDEALASLVETGKGDQASAIFEQLSAKAIEGGNSVEQLTGLLTQYELALQNAGGKANGMSFLGDAIGGIIPDIQGATTALDQASDAGQRLKDTFDALNGLLDKRSAFRNYQGALDDFTAALAKNGRSFDVNTEKGRANQAALDNIASSAGEAASHLSGLGRTKFIGGVVSQLRQMARDMGIPMRQVQPLINKLKEVGATDPKPKIDVQGVPKAHGELDAVKRHMAELNRSRATPTVNANTGAAISGINGVLHALSLLHDRTITVTEYHRTYGRQGIGDQNLATGGYVAGPGTATSDSIPARLSNGEYVVNAAAVARYGVDMLHAINGMRYASGGLVPTGVTTSNAKSTSGAGLQVNLNGPIQTTDVGAMARAVETRFRDAMTLAAMP